MKWQRMDAYHQTSGPYRVCKSLVGGIWIYTASFGSKFLANEHSASEAQAACVTHSTTTESHDEQR